MMTNKEMQWCASRVRPGAEDAATSSLRALLIETLIPLARRSVHRAMRALGWFCTQCFLGISDRCTAPIGQLEGREIIFRQERKQK